LLSTTLDQYLVFERGGYSPGYPPEYIEVIRYVIYSTRTNEEIREIPVSTTKSFFVDGGATAEKQVSKSDIPVSVILETFGGTVPRSPKNLTKRFLSDESGLYVLDGSDKILVFTANEMLQRDSGAGNAYAVELPKVINLLVGTRRQYYLTLRSFNGNGRHEVVMAMTR